MNRKEYDVAILGAGISGTLTSLLLNKLGYSTVLVDKSSHPRFALGESSTYITAELLKYLAEKYQAQELMDLAYYSDITASHPEITVGLKQYFQYMWHDINRGTDFNLDEVHEVVSELPRPVCQYYRSDFDHYVLKLAIASGSDYFDNTIVSKLRIDDSVFIECKREESVFNINSQFVIDASGFASVLNQYFGFKLPSESLDVPLKSRTIFTHFSKVESLESIMAQNDNFNKHWCINRHLSTQHHCFDGGWFWFIPFDNGITSVGLNLDMDVFPENSMEAEEEFWSIVNRLSVVKALLANVKNERGFIKTPRLQFRSENFAGDRWAALSSVAFGLDAWQSSGLSTTFMSIDRLIDVLHNQVFKKKQFKKAMFDNYNRILNQEYVHLCKMIHGIYKSFKHPEIFKLYSLVPFIGTLNFMKDHKFKNAGEYANMIFNFGDPEFLKYLELAYDTVVSLSKKQTVSAYDVENFRKILLDDMVKLNHRNYGDVEKHNAYFVQQAEITALA
jgi:FADH2 O2-dependent halogenase